MLVIGKPQDYQVNVMVRGRSPIALHTRTNMPHARTEIVNELVRLIGHSNFSCSIIETHGDMRTDREREAATKYLAGLAQQQREQT